MGAVDWLMDKISYDNGYGVIRNSFDEMKDLSEFFEQAKVMEKEQEFETKLYWFGRGILAGRENRIKELKPKRN